VKKILTRAVAFCESLATQEMTAVQALSAILMLNFFLRYDHITIR
jgi:hypothetical protein